MTISAPESGQNFSRSTGDRFIRISPPELWASPRMASPMESSMAATKSARDGSTPIASVGRKANMPSSLAASIGCPARNPRTRAAFRPGPNVRRATMGNGYLGAGHRYRQDGSGGHVPVETSPTAENLLTFLSGSLSGCRPGPFHQSSEGGMERLSQGVRQSSRYRSERIRLLLQGRLEGDPRSDAQPRNALGLFRRALGKEWADHSSAGWRILAVRNIRPKLHRLDETRSPRAT